MIFIAIMAIACFTVTAQAASVSKTIDSTGGDCSTIGAWDGPSKTCTLNGDVNGTISIVGNGITLDGAGHTLSGPRPDGGIVFNDSNITIKNLNVTGFGIGIFLSGGGNHTLTNDNLTGNDIGVYIDFSNGNTISCNDITGNGEGVYIDGNSNTVTGNNFTGNTVQAKVNSGSGNSFNVASPGGGNHWSDWMSPDANGDGFVDTAYVFPGGQDNRPWAAVSGWRVKPDLRLFKTDVRWASSADYLDRLLTVSFEVRNNGFDASNVKITGSTGPGVTLDTVVPLSLGGIVHGSAAPFELRYKTPESVNNFLASVFGSAGSCCGAGFTYP